MAITREEVLHVAKLARLALTDDEVERLTAELSAILEAVSKVSELDLVGRAADLASARGRQRLGRGRAAAVARARRGLRERAGPRGRPLQGAADRMSVARLRLAPVGETMFPPRAPFFCSVGGTSKFPQPPKAHRPGTGQ